MFSIIESSIFIPVISTPFIKQRWHCQITFQHLQAISLITSFVLPSSCCQHPSCKQLVYHPKSRLAVLANNLRHTQIRVSDEIFRNGKVDLENTSEQDISLNCQLGYDPLAIVPIRIQTLGPVYQVLVYKNSIQIWSPNISIPENPSIIQKIDIFTYLFHLNWQGQ